jgi:Domain of unknown function (DUF4328)
LLLVNIATGFAATAMSVLELIWPGDLFGDGFEENPVTLVLGLLAVLLAIIQVVVYIATIVVFLMWLYRAHENLAAFGVPKHQMEYSSGWTVGSFFIPIVSLFIPYRAIKEVWRKSIPDYLAKSKFAELDPPGFFPLWWGFWIISNIIDQIYFRLSWRDDVPADASAILGTISGVLGIIAAVLAIKVVREIQQQQVESSRLIAAQPAFASPPAPPQFDQQGNLAVPPNYNS